MEAGARSLPCSAQPMAVCGLPSSEGTPATLPVQTHKVRVPFQPPPPLLPAALLCEAQIQNVIQCVTTVVSQLAKANLNYRLQRSSFSYLPHTFLEEYLFLRKTAAFWWVIFSMHATRGLVWAAGPGKIRCLDWLFNSCTALSMRKRSKRCGSWYHYIYGLNQDLCIWKLMNNKHWKSITQSKNSQWSWSSAGSPWKPSKSKGVALAFPQLRKHWQWSSQL